MQHLDEGTIHAWLDDALDPAERAAAETHVAGCAECSAAVAEARGLIAASSRVLIALDDVPADVLPTGTIATPGGGRRQTRAWWNNNVVRVAIAASFMFAVASVFTSRDRANESAVVAPTTPPSAPMAVAPPASRDEPVAPKAEGVPAGNVASGVVGGVVGGVARQGVNANELVAGKTAGVGQPAQAAAPPQGLQTQLGAAPVAVNQSLASAGGAAADASRGPPPPPPAPPARAGQPAQSSLADAARRDAVRDTTRAGITSAMRVTAFDSLSPATVSAARTRPSPTLDSLATQRMVVALLQNAADSSAAIAQAMRAGFAAAGGGAAAAGARGGGAAGGGRGGGGGGGAGRGGRGGGTAGLAPLATLAGGGLACFNLSAAAVPPAGLPVGRSDSVINVPKLFALLTDTSLDRRVRPQVHAVDPAYVVAGVVPGLTWTSVQAGVTVSAGADTTRMLVIAGRGAGPAVFAVHGGAQTTLTSIPCRRQP
jgi:hypothetical protein